MKIEWNQSGRNAVKRTVSVRAAKRIETAAKQIAGTRFKVDRYGSTVYTKDDVARQIEYGDGVMAPEPWANQAIHDGLSPRGTRRDRDTPDR